MAAAVPVGLKLGAMIGGSLLGKKLSGPSKAQQQAMTQGQQGAQQIGQYASPLLQRGFAFAGEGDRDLGEASRYYRGILGSRTQAREALAPEMATALDFYRGAEGKAKRSLRGGSRDYALAELDRQKVGQLAGYLPQARAAAAQGLSSVGAQRLSGGGYFANLGTNAASSAGLINARLFDQASQLRDQQQQGGKSWGSILYDIAGSMPWGRGNRGTQIYGSPAGPAY